jgi:hypothetical protein
VSAPTHDETGLAAAAAALPSGPDLRTLLNSLFDTPVVVREETAPVLPGRLVKVVGSYLDDQGALRAVIMLDVVLGCALGAALALLPAPRVEEAVASDVVPPELGENTREVLNIAASLFNSAEAHLKLRAVEIAPEPVADDVVRFLRSQPYRSDFTIEVPGYGTGTSALLLR